MLGPPLVWVDVAGGVSDLDLSFLHRRVRAVGPIDARCGPKFPGLSGPFPQLPGATSYAQLSIGTTRSKW